MPEIEPAVQVIRCDDDRAGQWDAFVQDCPGASFYHLFGWKQINENSFGHETIYLAALQGGSLRGVLPVVYLKSRIFGNILCSMPFVNYGGPCSSDDRCEQVLLGEAASIVRERGADYLEIRGLKKVGMELPTSEHKVSLTVGLKPDAEELWEAFSTKHRTNIRRSYKNGLEVKVGASDLLDTFYGLLSENWRNLGTPIYGKGYFERILSTFPERIRIFAVYQRGTPVGAAMNGYFRDTVEGMWAATSAKHRDSDPNYVLYWEMIKHACENGYAVFHLGRSTAGSGGDLFKRKWNADPRQLYWQYVLGKNGDIPQLNVNNPKYRLAIRTWRALPVGITNLVGPYLSRSIP